MTEQVFTAASTHDVAVPGRCGCGTGRVGGRPKALAQGKRQRAVQLYQEKQLTVKEICEMMGISKPTLYSYLAETGG